MAGLKGKVVLITGASSGIGRATAIHFSGLGCRVSIVARNLGLLKTAAEECKAAGAEEVFFTSHDLSTEAGCEAAVDDTVNKFGGLLFIISCLVCY
jgi:NAD(P)-dependent dehydrogenase (short-subunit alcohol dehydrogenase family)